MSEEKTPEEVKSDDSLPEEPREELQDEARDESHDASSEAAAEPSPPVEEAGEALGEELPDSVPDGSAEVFPAVGEEVPPAPIEIDQKDRVKILRDVSLQVRVELGRGKMLLKDLLRLTQGSVVELDKLAGEPLDIYVNNRLIARGEVLVLDEKFCIRITEILTPEDCLRAKTG